LRYPKALEVATYAVELVMIKIGRLRVTVPYVFEFHIQKPVHYIFSNSLVTP